MSSKKTILICPLNWGLGHATRMIPVIDSAILQGHTVIIASDGDAFLLLRNHYPDINCIKLPSLTIKYGTGFFSHIKLFFSVPKILVWIKNDTKVLTSITNEYAIDLIISDNRWGMWSKRVKSVFVTHQLMIKLPRLFSFLEKTIFNFQQRILNHFDEIWIPDSEDPILNLSGQLSHKYKAHKPTKFIGILSQFSNSSDQKEFQYDVAIILSGPEPQRSILEKLLIDKMNILSLKTIVVGGTFVTTIKNRNPNIEYQAFANTDQLQEIYNSSKHIICRSGYTSLMDLIKLGKTAIIIPTPKQTEQEYLAKYVSANGWFKTLSQKGITTLSKDSFIDSFDRSNVAINYFTNYEF